MRIFERRKHKQLIPSDFEQYLNADQMNTYIHMQELGWQMYFIRRPFLRKCTVVMKNNAGTRIAVIEQGGGFTVNPRRIIRQCRVHPSRRTLSELLPVNDSKCA